MIRSITVGQHGLIRTAQLRLAGATRSSIVHARRTGVLERLSSEVYRLGGSPRTIEQRRLAALFDAGGDAAMGQVSGARLWELWPRLVPDHVLVTRRSAFDRPTLGVVHRVRDLLPSHVVVLDGLRVTTPARVIMDLAAILPRSQVARVLDRAWGKRLLAIGDVASVLHDVRGKGRRGVRTVEALLAERVGHVSAETALELAFEDILLANSLPPMRRQVQLSDVEGWVGRVDYFDDDHGLVVFVDGDAWHRALTDTRSDAAQQHRLVAAGYRVARFSEGEIRFRQRSVASRMRDLRPARLAA